MIASRELASQRVTVDRTDAVHLGDAVDRQAVDDVQAVDQALAIVEDQHRVGDRALKRFAQAVLDERQLGIAATPEPRRRRRLARGVPPPRAASSDSAMRWVTTPSQPASGPLPEYDASFGARRRADQDRVPEVLLDLLDERGRAIE